MSKLHAGYSDPSKFGSASVVPQPALPLYGTSGQQSAQYGQQQPIQQQPSLYVPFPAQVTIQTIAVPANVETRMAQFMFPCHPSANINPVRMTCPSCRQEINTATRYETGCCTWLYCINMAFMGLCLCCWMPFRCDCSKDVIHTCPQCKVECGKFQRHQLARKERGRNRENNTNDISIYFIH